MSVFPILFKPSNVFCYVQHASVDSRRPTVCSAAGASGCDDVCDVLCWRVLCCQPDVLLLLGQGDACRQGEVDPGCGEGRVLFRAEGASQTCTVIGMNGWAPIRIDVSTRDLDDARKYCSSERY
ncbi:hypothetical protein Tc00.1047053510961.21 [Trypanosoma cruzi]|uniref:Uncharacterized protein n=1 Tax=Trypanosoma cruzi (strain CL Brener) TaxID=353153 RepID=Q4CXA3_TRYCC|nr:hypothetical protein Tc00.1047053510961.21 [Trypanosoma cruzi]EAN84907.1 hypothetical protein Tc00.1047053510961.21 [Trypanosoma cruzi]|eukprot:XP_806758.1 hypothetical protein [Trypanosoma cruzi strain CL Brener]